MPIIYSKLCQICITVLPEINEGSVVITNAYYRPLGLYPPPELIWANLEMVKAMALKVPRIVITDLICTHPNWVSIGTSMTCPLLYPGEG